MERISDDVEYIDQNYLDGNTIVIKENGEFRNFLAFTDNIGSILSVIDEEGRSVFDASYDAWGRQTVTKNEIGLRRGYTGHEMLNEVGIWNVLTDCRDLDPRLREFEREAALPIEGLHQKQEKANAELSDVKFKYKTN